MSQKGYRINKYYLVRDAYEPAVDVLRRHNPFLTTAGKDNSRLMFSYNAGEGHDAFTVYIVQKDAYTKIGVSQREGTVNAKFVDAIVNMYIDIDLQTEKHKDLE